MGLQWDKTEGFIVPDSIAIKGLVFPPLSIGYRMLHSQFFVYIKVSLDGHTRVYIPLHVPEYRLRMPLLYVSTHSKPLDEPILSKQPTQTGGVIHSEDSQRAAPHASYLCVAIRPILS